MLPFAELDTKAAQSSIEITSRVSTGVDEPRGCVPSVESPTLIRNVVRTAERPGHPLDWRSWRSPVIGDSLWRVDGQLADGGSTCCWIVCAL